MPSRLILHISRPVGLQGRKWESQLPGMRRWSMISRHAFDARPVSRAVETRGSYVVRTPYFAAIYASVRYGKYHGDPAGASDLAATWNCEIS